MHEEDNLNADMPTDSWDEKITEFNFDISDKKIPNIYQKFIIYFDFVLNSQYTPEEYNFFIRTYDISQNIISFPLMYGGININKYMKTDGYIDFDNNTSSYYGSCDFDRPNVTNTGFSFLLDINYITFDDCLLNINFLCHIASTNDFESLEYPFDSSRLAIYGATPVYK